MDGLPSFCCSSLHLHSLSLEFELWAVTVLLTVSICPFPANFWVRPPADKRSLGCFSADKVFNYSSYISKVPRLQPNFYHNINKFDLVSEVIMYINLYIVNCPILHRPRLTAWPVLWILSSNMRAMAAGCTGGRNSVIWRLNFNTCTEPFV